MKKLGPIGVFTTFLFATLSGLSQYNSFEQLSLSSPNISQKGEVYTSVNIPISFCEITAAYAPFNNVVIHATTNFGSMQHNASKFNQTVGLGVVRQVKKECVIGFRSFVGYHKFFYQNLETGLHDLPYSTAPLNGNNRITNFCYYQYNSASIQGDITLDISNVQLYMCSSLMWLNYSYLRIFSEFKSYGMQERFDFSEMHHTFDVGLRYAVVKNFFVTTNIGMRSLIHITSPSKNPLESQTLDLYYLNFGFALKFDTKKSTEN
ncbi:MAG: hypothetical protein ACK4WD_04325 [Flavobacteriales bacterium]|jgi:hypothetical protein